VIDSTRSETPFLGLAPFLRRNLAGVDLLPITREMLAQAQREPGDANLWMNLSIAMLSLGQRESGLAVQTQALALQRVYHLAASRQPARLRLLMLLAPGDLAANTPLECLIENGDIDLDFYYLSSGGVLASPIPDHDALIVALAESDENHDLLAALARALARWPNPVINRPRNIPATGRLAASRLLRNVPGLRMPPVLRAPRPPLLAIAAGSARLSEAFPDCDFPVILRPVGSHAGRGLAKMEGSEEIAAYLSKVDAAEYFLSPFVDYRSPDGLFRKARVALIDGAPFACHMAVSSHWMIHYLNAGMYQDARKRGEEANFMARFDEFAARHRPALDAIHERTQLDYLCIDCAEAPDGRLLVFEIDHTMVVHAMDPENLFPYKKAHMRKVQKAFRDLLLRRTTAPGRNSPGTR